MTRVQIPAAAPLRARDHLLVNGEEYVEEGFAKLTKLRFRALTKIPLEGMAEALRSAGYVIQAPC